LIDFVFILIYIIFFSVDIHINKPGWKYRRIQ